MRYGFNLLLLVMVLAACVAALAQTPTYNVGRTATQQEIEAWDISVGSAGKELPPGSGTAKEGAKIFAQKCAVCHGPTGAESTLLWGRLVGGKGTLTAISPVRTVGSMWPYATAIWDYINRAMPAYPIASPREEYGRQEGALSANEVYALTAVLLYRNGIIQESDVIDAKSLPKVQMPNRNGFIPATRGTGSSGCDWILTSKRNDVYGWRSVGASLFLLVAQRRKEARQT